MKSVWEQAAATVPAILGQAIGWKDGYAAGFKAGLEAAAKVCDSFEEWAVSPMDLQCAAREIRALSPSPSATVQTQTDALPRPESETK